MKDEREGKDPFPVEPTRLAGGSRLQFACHKGLSCFGTCCRDMEVTIAPYDIVRLKKRLGISSGEFLDRYTVSTTHGESGLPIVILKKAGGANSPCPFLTGKGCSVYSDRPSICRYYPVGLASLRTRTDPEKPAGEEHFYFLVREKYCLGHGEKKVWTIDEWRRDQGVSEDDAINRDWQTAFLSRNLPGKAVADEKRQAHFYLACYDIDAFRRFVFESPFLERFEIDAGTVEKIRDDEVELLRFALRYMKFFMMIEETMKTREGVVEGWQKKHQDTLNEQTGAKPPSG